MLVGGLGITAGGRLALGIPLVALGFAATLTVSTVFSAVFTYARTLIYRYAVGRGVPADAVGLLGGAFSTKRRR